jgi:GNAT superfamily N-acetyltransferase
MSDSINKNNEVRKATIHDWNFLWSLLYKMGKTDSEQEVKERYLKIIESQEHYIPVALNGNKIIAYAWAQDYGFHLRSGKKIIRMNDLFTDPEYRNLGAARCLIDALKIWSIERKASWLQWNSSPKAIDFYNRIGIEPLLEEDDYPFFEIDLEQQHKKELVHNPKGENDE